MAIPANICVAWPSTAASIPTGWTRETALDSRYTIGAPAGADADLTTDRGNTTHNHTSASHNPTQNAHTHEFQTTSGASTSIVSGTSGGAAADINHGHDAQTSTSVTATNNGVAITVDATSNDLAFVEVIWIKSDGTPTTLPSGCIAFFASDSLPSGWSRVHADTYLKGAVAAGNGGTTGGSNTHTHTSPAHTHTQNLHSHTGTSGGANVVQQRGNGADTASSSAHTHAVTLNSLTATNQSVTTTIDSTSHEPPFSKLNIIQTSGDSLPSNIIALWLGTHASIPSDWSRYTAMDSKWLKGTSADGQVGNTGGSSQHTHTASDCQPIQNAHSHSITDAGGVGSTTPEVGIGATFASPGHTHSWSTTSETPTNNAVDVFIDDCSVDAALPKHRRVIYVQFSGTPARGPSVYTSYSTGRFDISDPETRLLPEVEKKISQGDLRFIPR